MASYTALDGSTFTFGYDAVNNLQSISIPGEGSIQYTDYRWTRPGRVLYPGGTVRTLGYDGLLRSETIHVRNAANDVLMDYRYEYDAAGNITRKQTEHGPLRLRLRRPRPPDPGRLPERAEQRPDRRQLRAEHLSVRG